MSGARHSKFDENSELSAKLSFLLKRAAIRNNHLREIENEKLAQKINEERIFESKNEDPFDEVFEILDDRNIEHKKSMFPYDEPVPETVGRIRTMQQLIDDDFIDLQTEFDKPNDVVNKQIKQKKKMEETVDSILDEKNPFSTFDDFWWEDEMFSDRDSILTVEASKDILKNVRPVNDRTIEQITDDQFIPIDDRTQQELEDDNYASFESETDDAVTVEDVDETDNKPDDNRPIQEIIQKIIDDQNNAVTVKDVDETDNKPGENWSIQEKIQEIIDDQPDDNRPIDNRTIQEIIDDQFIPIDDRTLQELQDDNNISVESKSKIENIDLTSVWDNKKTAVAKPGPIIKLSTDYNQKIKVANKVKNKYL